MKGGKLHPLIFETAVATLGVAPAATWFVGDNLGADIVGANESGLFPVWYYNPDAKENRGIELGTTIRSWDELGELLLASSSNRDTQGNWQAPSSSEVY